MIIDDFWDTLYIHGLSTFVVENHSTGVRNTADDFDIGLNLQIFINKIRIILKIAQPDKQRCTSTVLVVNVSMRQMKFSFNIFNFKIPISIANNFNRYCE